MAAKKAFQSVATAAANTWARACVGTLLVVTGASAQAAGEFTDRLNNARTIDTKSMRDSSKQAADNIGFIVTMGSMVIGFVFLIWGVLWIMSAGRSDGRKEAKGGWIMAVGGGALGAVGAIYGFVVGAFSGAVG